MDYQSIRILLFIVVPFLSTVYDHAFGKFSLEASHIYAPESIERCKEEANNIQKIESLLQDKAQLIQARINSLHTKATSKLQGLDSLSNTRVGDLVNDNLEKLSPEQYTTKLNGINQSLETYKSKVTDNEELTWVEHYSGQLDQLDGVVTQYQDKLLNMDELQALKGYSQQLQQLSQESSGYFQER